MTVRNVPRGLRQFYLVADGPGGATGPQLVRFHAHRLEREDPREGGQMWYWNYPDDQRFAPLQWPDAERDSPRPCPDGTWALWWFGSGDFIGPSPARYILGGGRAEFRLPDVSQATVPTRELLKRVGLPEKPAAPVTPGSSLRPDTQILAPEASVNGDLEATGYSVVMGAWTPVGNARRLGKLAASGLSRRHVL